MGAYQANTERLSTLQNTGQHLEFNQEFYNHLKNKNKILLIPTDEDINRHNAFEQGYERLSVKFKDKPELIYMEEIDFPKSKYKGQVKKVLI
jgi:hypothetical protein